MTRPPIQADLSHAVRSSPAGRHTCASLLFASGKNVKQVQRWLGHADPGFTMRTYVHLVDDGVGDASSTGLAPSSALATRW